MIATLADSYITTREEFELTSGFQPIDSLFYVKSGSFRYRIEGDGEYTASSGDFIIFNKSTRMERSVLSRIEMLYVKFYPLKSGLYNITLTKPIKAEGRIKEDLEIIEELSADRSPQNLQMRNHYFNDLLITLLRKNDANTQTQALPIETAIDKAVAFIESNLKRKITVSEIAEAVGMSVSSLESKFTSIIGKSVYDYIIGTRMRCALQLLTTTALSVTDIAVKCGYDNVFYFCNAFKKTVGCTPSQFRMRALNGGMRN